MNGQYLIAANTKKGQLIFSIFRRVDLIIAIVGASLTLLLFIIIQPSNLGWGIVTLLPILVCAFLVMPIPNYHNVLCILENIYNFYFVDRNQLKWRGWEAKYEFKD